MAFFKWLGVACLALAIGWNPIAPPEHVHEADGHGADHAVVHRHDAAHFATGHHVDPDHAATFDHEEGTALSLDPAYGLPSATREGTAPALAGYAAALIAPVSTPSSAVTAYRARLTHGPPRGPTGLRAPPAFPLL